MSDQLGFSFDEKRAGDEGATTNASAAEAAIDSAARWTLGSGAGSLLDRARTAGAITSLDRQFAMRLGGLYGEEREGVLWGLALACRQEASGHVCADLVRLSEEGLVAEVAGETRIYSVLVAHSCIEDWLAELRESDLVQETGEGDSKKPCPLILDSRGRLYLSRAHRHQADLAARLLRRSEAPAFEVDDDWVDAALARISQGEEAADAAARDALRVGLTRPLAVVTGGPGTGKTTMAARLISLLIESALSTGAPPPRVKLLAPTGKAAAAMANAFARGREQRNVEEAVRDALPRSAETIHRVLHSQTRRGVFGRPQEIALAADVVVVDEASMVDLELMSRLFAACESVPRIVLLGDPDQLASVDAGAVLGEICSAPHESNEPQQPESTGLACSLARLTRSHRFSEGGGIGQLAAAIREGNADAVLSLLEDPAVEGIERVDVGGPGDVVARLVGESRAMHEAIATATEPREKLARMTEYRVLCAHRLGPLGVEALGARLDDAAAAFRKTTTRDGWWCGRMLLVTRNAPDQDLWNGDVGLVEETEVGLRALFSDGAGGVRALSAGRLPPHESAIAMSVHKSQGSEFDTVDLVLGDRTSPIMTRELFYTGVTRARTTLRVHASAAAIRAMVERPIRRDSGLAELLWPS